MQIAPDRINNMHLFTRYYSGLTKGARPRYTISASIFSRSRMEQNKATLVVYDAVCPTMWLGCHELDLPSKAALSPSQVLRV